MIKNIKLWINEIFFKIIKNILRRRGYDITHKDKNYNIQGYLKYKKIEANTINLEDFKTIIQFPKKICKHKKDDICIHIGPYGYYMKCGKKNYKIFFENQGMFIECGLNQGLKNSQNSEKSSSSISSTLLKNSSVVMLGKRPLIVTSHEFFQEEKS